MVTHEAGEQDFMAESGFLEIDDTALRIVCDGTGVPVLVLGSSIYYPRTFTDSLRKRCRLICAELRYFSKARRTIAPATDIEAYVSDIVVRH